MNVEQEEQLNLVDSNRDDSAPAGQLSSPGFNSPLEMAESDHDLPGEACPLRPLVERDDMRTLKTLLYECVWERFSLDPTAGFKLPGTENEGLPEWFLHAAVFCGCPVLLDYTLRKRSCRELYNARIDCKFPLTDTWIHRSFKLCLSPLHLACWRLDCRAIESLLAYGADPNILALEESNSHDFRNFPLAAKDGKTTHTLPAQTEGHGAGNDPPSGLCPLHFIALGIRASPKTSLFAGIQESIMHDTPLYVNSPTDGKSIAPESDLADVPNEKQRHVLREQSQNEDPRLSANHLKCFLLTEHISKSRSVCDKSPTIARCIEVLLAAGAKPDFCPPQKVLIGANPLDTVLQPPMRIFYAPSAARGNQNAAALRRQDLAQTADHVIAACDILLRHGASVSPSFLDLYSWRPGILDCFHLYNSEQSRQLVRYCVRLGLFSAEKLSFGEPSRAYDFGRYLSSACYHTVFSPSGEATRTPTADFNTTMMIRRFVADVVNMEIPLPLAAIVLSWCPFSILLCAKRETNAAIKSMRDRDRAVGPLTHDLNSSGLAELAQVVRELQLSSLKHKCALAVLQSIGFRQNSVLELPLPPPIQRALINLSL